LDRRKFLELALGAGVMAAYPKGTAASVPKISRNEAFQTSSSDDESLANYTPEKHRPTALHKTNSETDIKTDLEGFLEICNPTATEAFTSILTQFEEASRLIEKNIKANTIGRLNNEETIYSNADKWASAITAAPIWVLSLASRTLGDSITAGIELSKSDKSSLSTMFAYNAQTFSITYIKNFLVESLRNSLIEQMKLNNELDPRRINAQAVFKDLNQNRDSLKIKFSENLQSIYEIPKSFKEASLDRKILDSGSIGIGFLLSLINTGLGKFISSLGRQRIVGENALRKELGSENYNKQAKIAVTNAITYPSFNLINGICQELVKQTITLDSSSQLAQTNFRELIGNLSSFLAYMFIKVPFQNKLEHAMHKQIKEQGEFRTPLKEIAELMEPSSQ
jgi:hypothetical protein